MKTFKTFNCYEISHIKEAEVREDGKETRIFIFLRSKCYWRFIKIKIINTSTSQILSNEYINGVKDVKLLDDKFCGTARADLNRTIYDDTKFSICKISYIIF